MRFPNLDCQDGKTHVLFLAAFLSPSGFHRMIQPALELNRTSTHSAIVANICKWDYTKRFEDQVYALDERLIHWADFLVVPAIFGKLDKLESLKAINPKLRLAMDVDLCYHELPANHPQQHKQNEADLDQLLVNMVAADVVTVPTSTLGNFYAGLVDSAFRFSTARFAQYPNLVSDTAFPGNFPLKRNLGSTLRVGVFASPTEPEVLEAIAPILIQVEEQLQGSIEYLLFGWSDKAPLPTDFSCELVPPASIIDYYERLNECKLDIALLPAQDTTFSHCKSDIKFLELSALGIPVIAAGQAPYSNMIMPGDNGLLAHAPDEWEAALVSLATNNKKREAIGSYAFRFAWRNLAWNRLKRTMLADVFSLSQPRA